MKRLISILLAGVLAAGLVGCTSSGADSAASHTPADYTAALAAGDFDLYLGEVRLTGDFDCTTLVSGALNYGSYASAEVSQMLNAWCAASGQARVTAAQALREALADDLPFAVLCFKNQSLLVRWGMVENLAPVQGNPFAGVETWQTEEN